MISKTFCPLPFNHIYIHPTNRAAVCCNFRSREGLPKIQEYDKLEDHLYHPFMVDIQQKMLAGEKVEGCATCYFAEEHGYESMREKEIDQWSGTHAMGMSAADLEKPKLNFVEITFGNYCNLACRSCGSDLSHSWIEENPKLQEAQLPSNRTMKRLNIEREWEDDDFKDLEYLKVTGGEPMLHPDWFKFNSKFDPTNIKMFIFTNASWVPKKRHLDLLNKFKSCQIFLSIDGTGSVQEYMRHNSKWDITDKSARAWMNFMKENKNIQLSWAPTWSLMNANYFIETCNWWLDTINEILGARADDCGTVKTNFLYGPYEYQIGNLPEANRLEIKNDVQDYIDNLPMQYGLDEIEVMGESFIQYIENDKDVDPKQIETFYGVTEFLNKSRNQSTEEMMPKTYKAMYIDTIL